MLLVLFAILGITLCVSCSDDDDKENGDDGGGTTATTPFSSVKVEADGETVTGSVDGTTITFAFDRAENFSSCRLMVELNTGWQLTYPTDVDDYDMSDDPDLYFKGPDGSKPKYKVVVTSNALPIIDASKITVEGGYALEINNATKEMVITYDANMDRSNVRLNFAEGALMAGATVETTTFDLSDDTVTLNIRVAGTNRSYILKIDYSALMTPASEFGFQDVTEDYVNKAEYPYITVMKINNATLSNVIDKKPVKPNPERWDPSGWYGKTQAEAMAVLGDFNDPATYPGITNISGVNFTVVTLDASKVKGKLIIDDQNSVSLSEVNNLVVVTGNHIADKGNAGGRGILYGDNKVYSDKLAWIESQPLNVQFGECFGFTEDGKISFDVATVKDNTLMKVRFYNADYSEDIDDRNKFPEPEETFDCRNYLDGAWNVKYVASGYPWLVRKGEKLTYKQVMGNNGFNDSMGDNETNRRGLIGKTYDGKIGIAVVGVGDADGADGLTLLQAAYVLNKMGWKEIMSLGATGWLTGNSWLPSIKINGQLVSGVDGEGSAYVVAFDAK